jgi:hypothetical protein
MMTRVERKLSLGSRCVHLPGGLLALVTTGVAAVGFAAAAVVTILVRVSLVTILSFSSSSNLCNLASFSSSTKFSVFLLPSLDLPLDSLISSSYESSYVNTSLIHLCAAST